MNRLTLPTGVSINVPDHLSKIYGNFEPATTEVISATLRQGDVFVDIGANVGYFTALAASLVGSAGTVYAVEASPEVLPILESNVAAFGNVKVIESAVGSRTGVTKFFQTDDLVNSGVAQNPFDRAGREITVPIAPLDHLLSQAGLKDFKVDFIKCDVQGDEMQVLEGARRLIESSANLSLIVEWAPTWMRAAGADPEELPSFLRALGFARLVVIDDWTQRILPVELMQEEFRGDKKGNRFCNLFASKSKTVNINLNQGQ